MDFNEARSTIMEAYDIIKKLNNMELAMKLADVQGELLKQKGENMKLQEEVNLLNTRVDISERVERNLKLYITLKDEKPKLKYCSRCYDVDGKLVQLNYVQGQYYDCRNCSNHFTLDGDKPSKEETIIDVYGGF